MWQSSKLEGAMSNAKKVLHNNLIREAIYVFGEGGGGLVATVCLSIC